MKRVSVLYTVSFQAPGFYEKMTICRPMRLLPTSIP